MFRRIFDVLVEITPKLQLKRYDLTKEATDVIERKFYPAVAKELGLKYVKKGRIDALFQDGCSIAIEHENEANKFVHEEVYKLVNHSSSDYKVGITYESNEELRQLILASTKWLWRRHRCNLMVIIGHAPQGVNKPFIIWEGFVLPQNEAKFRSDELKLSLD